MMNHDMYDDIPDMYEDTPDMYDDMTYTHEYHIHVPRYRRCPWAQLRRNTVRITSNFNVEDQLKKGQK